MSGTSSRYKRSCALISDAVVADAISNSLIQCAHCVGHRLNDSVDRLVIVAKVADSRLHLLVKAYDYSQLYA